MPQGIGYGKGMMKKKSAMKKKGSAMKKKMVRKKGRGMKY